MSRPSFVGKPSAPVEVPRITAFQAKAALADAGQLTIVENIVNNPAMSPRIKIAWDNSLDFRRDNPMIIAVANQLEWTEQYLNDLFAAGAAISPDV